MSSTQKANKNEIVFVPTSVALPGNTLLENLYCRPTQECKLGVLHNGTVETLKEYRDKSTGIVYRPLCDSTITRNILLLPSKAELMADIQAMDMVEEVRAFIHHYVDLDPGIEELAARYVVMTWVYDAFEKVPYFRILGSYGTGKSRLLNVFAALCRLSLRMGTGITPANVFRQLGKYPNATLLLDEANFDNMNPSNLFVQILNGGYSREGVVSRLRKDTYDVEYFSTFGPKIIAGNRPYEDEGLESRMITANAFQSLRRDLPYELPAYSEWTDADALRNKLLSFRFCYYQLVKQNPRPDMPEDFNPRLCEILSPLFRTTGEEVIPHDVLCYLKDINYQRAISNMQTDEAYIVMLLEEKKALGERSVSIGSIANELFTRNNIAISAKKVGILMRPLGITANKRTSAGFMVDLTSTKIEEVAKRYRLPDRPF